MQLMVSWVSRFQGCPRGNIYATSIVYYGYRYT